MNKNEYIDWASKFYLCIRLLNIFFHRFCALILWLEYNTSINVYYTNLDYNEYKK